MKVVVIGGVAAGMSAASKARRLLPEAQIDVYERGEHVSYGACGIPYVISGEIGSFEKLVARTPAQFAKQQIGVHVRHDVLEIDPERRQIVVEESGARRRVDYDQLVIATGARPLVLPVPGAELAGLFPIRTLDDGKRIQSALSEGARHAVVVGGGYIGLEMAEALTLRGLRVTLLEMMPQLFGGLDPELANPLAEHLRERGVELALETRVEGFDGPGRVAAVRTSRGVVDDVDLVVLAVGVRPSSELAGSIGLSRLANGAIVVDPQLRTNRPEIFAAGDVTAVSHRVSGQLAYIPLGDTANKQGRVVGSVIGGEEASFEGVVGTSIARVFERAVARTGLSLLEAERSGIAALAAQIEASDHAHFFPDRHPISVRVVYRADDRRLLGAQIVGHGDAVKRIDTVAALLQLGGTVDDLARLDLAYAPPFSPVWDPLLVAANNA